MDLQIAALLAQDGVTNGAIYALLAIALVMVFAVTRVILIPQGEFVSYGALTLAALQSGHVPGSVWLAVGLAFVACVMEAVELGRSRQAARIPAAMLRIAALPVAVAVLVVWAAPWPRSGRCCTASPTSPWPRRLSWCC